MIEGKLRDILGKLDITVVSKSEEGWLRCPCPFAEFLHDSGTDRDPSFFVRATATQLSGFHCFTCKEHGRVSSLVRRLEFWRKESYVGLAMEADLAETPDSFDEYEQEFDYNVDPTPLDKEVYLGMYGDAYGFKDARDYLIRRGISEETNDLLQLKYDPEEHRILFPVFDYKTDLFGFSGRSILTEKQIEHINLERERTGRYVEYSKIKDYAGLRKEKMLLGDHLIEAEKPLWIVEGLFAFAMAVEVGARRICNPVATLGSNLSKYQRDLLVEHNLPVYLCFDNDKAGEIGIYGRPDHRGRKKDGALDMLKKHVPTFVPLYPEGKNDPDNLTFEDIQLMLKDPNGNEFSG